MYLSVYMLPPIFLVSWMLAKFQIYSVSFTELLESKMSLVTKSKDALDETVVHYKKFVGGIPASLL